MTDTTVDPTLLTRILDPATRADPYPLYRALREAGAVVRLVQPPVVVVSSYDACQTLLRDPRASNDQYKLFGPPAAPDEQWVARPFLLLDPPEHTRLRRLVTKAFTARTVQRLEEFLRDTVDDLLDAAAARGRFDALADLAHPLPVAVICRMLGVPAADEDRFGAWSSELARSLDPFIALTGAPAEGQADRLAAGQAFREYLGELVEERRARPGDDLLSELIAAEEAGDVLTTAELVTTCMLLLSAGHETTVNLIANGILQLLRHPDELAALAADPGGRAAAVVEETLRFDPPAQFAMRFTTEDIDVAGARVPAGRIVIVLLAAAHRDPAAIAEPDRFDPSRAEIPHLAFGLGPHYCLGAPLARLEGRAAFARFARRVHAPRLVQDPPPYKQHVILRGVSELPLELDGIAGRDVPWT